MQDSRISWIRRLRLMSYSTKPIEECIIEAHDIYCDIQFSLIGGEGISIYKRELLTQIEKDEQNDFVSFQEDGKPSVIVNNFFGSFTLIHTNEAHRPQEIITGDGYVKKGVIKIKEKLFDEE